MLQRHSFCDQTQSLLCSSKNTCPWGHLLSATHHFCMFNFSFSCFPNNHTYLWHTFQWKFSPKLNQENATVKLGITYSPPQHPDYRPWYSALTFKWQKVDFCLEMPLLPPGELARLNHQVAELLSFHLICFCYDGRINFIFLKPSLINWAWIVPWQLFWGKFHELFLLLVTFHHSPSIQLSQLYFCQTQISVLTGRHFTWPSLGELQDAT